MDMTTWSRHEQILAGTEYWNRLVVPDESATVTVDRAVFVNLLMEAGYLPEK